MIEKTTDIAAQGGAMIKIPLLLPLWASLLSDAREIERERERERMGCEALEVTEPQPPSATHR